MKSIIAVIVLTLISAFAFASGDHGEGESDPSQRVGPGKAVEAFDKEEGFKLSAKAVKSLGISFESVQGAGPWRIPKQSLVRIKQSSGVYRKYEEWISFVLVKVVKEENEMILIHSEDLEAGDQIAIKGAHYLRMTDADLNAGTVDSCAH